MSRITGTETHGSIDIDYAVEAVLVHQEGEPPMFVTKVHVQTYWDGDVDVTLYGVPATKNGQPHKGRTPEYIWLDDEDKAEVLRDLGIDTTVLPVIRSLTAGPQEEEEQS